MAPEQAVEPTTALAFDPQEQLVREATQAVQVGVWVSATRCVLTYVVAPAMGALGVVLGPVGLVLQLLGAITATAGARRLWRLQHRLRLPYAGVALAVDVVSLVSLLGVTGQVLR